MGIEVRKATAEDASFLAQMILKSSRASKKIGLFDLIFDTRDDAKVLEMLERLSICELKSYLHYTNFLIAELDGKRVGTLCSYEPRVANQETFLKALEQIGVETDENESLEVLRMCSFELNNKILRLDFMQEIEGFVDAGVLKALMQKALLNARLKGYRLAETIIEKGSLEDLLYYKKLGFSESKERECEPYRELFGRSGLKLLVIEF